MSENTPVRRTLVNLLVYISSPSIATFVGGHSETVCHTKSDNVPIVRLSPILIIYRSDYCIASMMYGSF